MKTILVLTDFSVRANYAAEFALKIGVKVEANIILCNAMEIVEPAPMAEQLAWPIADHISLKQDSLEELKDIAQNLKNSIPANTDASVFKPSITCIAEFGKLSAVSAALVKERNVNLVVMGLHKSNSLSRFLFGCHTHDVLDTINCPVLLVPEDLYFEEIHTIAYATDLTFSDSKVINYLAEIAKPFNAKILVSHISVLDIESMDEESKAQHSANKSLEQTHPKVFYTSIKGDNVPKCLLDAYGSGNADILTLVHKRYGFFDGLFHSSVSKKLANTARIPLLILPYCFSVDIADISTEQLDNYCYEPRNAR